jgi:hypothetical protein
MELTPSEADLAIMADKDLGYRVLDLSVDPFNSARTSYFHRSVGGYHGAKLGRYQEVIDRYLANLDPEMLAALNTRYVIYDGRAVALADAVGAAPYGAAWFVEGVVACNTAAEELEAIGSVDLQSVAVVSAGADVADKDYDASGSIELTEYAPNYLSMSMRVLVRHLPYSLRYTLPMAGRHISTARGQSMWLRTISSEVWSYLRVSTLWSGGSEHLSGAWHLRLWV